MIPLYYGHDGTHEFWADALRKWLILHPLKESLWMVHYCNDLVYGCQYPGEAAASIGAVLSTAYSWQKSPGGIQLVRNGQA